MSSKEFQKAFSEHQSLLMEMRAVMRRERKKKSDDAAARASSGRSKKEKRKRRASLRRQQSWDANGHVKQVASAKKAAKHIKKLGKKLTQKIGKPALTRTRSGSLS